MRPNASTKAPPASTSDPDLILVCFGETSKQQVAAADGFGSGVQSAALVGPADFKFKLAGDLQQQVLLAIGGDQLDTDR